MPCCVAALLLCSVVYTLSLSYNIVPPSELLSIIEVVRVFGFLLVQLYHLESRCRNSHVLVDHGPLGSHLWGVSPSTFTTV